MIECMKDCTENTCCGQSNLVNNKSVASQLKYLTNQKALESQVVVESATLVVSINETNEASN